jgi:hypothetical protein
MIGEEAFLEIEALVASGEWCGIVGDSGESNDDEDGKGTESWAGGRERNRGG